jgi:patatin-related protein
LTGPPVQPTPPAEPTTAAQPGIARPAAAPERPKLTFEKGDKLDPRPETLATQEIRFALTFTGGVSLAVWMGGVAREIDLLVQASACRRTMDQKDPPDPSTPDNDPLRRHYRRLLDLMDANVAVDVLSGTSAGGINAALLGLVNVRGLDLSKLRDIWLRAGDLGLLMRDPNEEAPPSLLKGDQQMLAELNSGIALILRGEPMPAQGLPRRTDVFITTTLLSPETSTFSDDYGTQITDTDHHGLFHFDTDMLTADDVVAPLALAARSTASFPAAFEPSFLPVGAAGSAGTTHPDMAPHSNIRRSHWAADGGLLVNRPIAPLLQTIFDRATDRQVRRLLLYVVPTSGPAKTKAEDSKAAPLGLPQALLADLAATENQSIAADLAAIREHNDRTRAAADTRLRLVNLGNRLASSVDTTKTEKADTRLVDQSAWEDYKRRQADWLMAPLVAELTSQLAAPGANIPESWAPRPGTDRDAVLRAAAHDAITDGWPAIRPTGAADAARLGRPAYDGAKATVLHLLRLGYVLSSGVTERNDLAKSGMRVHRALPDTLQTDLRSLVADAIRQSIEAEESPEALVTRICAAFLAGQGGNEALAGAWTTLAKEVADASHRLASMAGAAPSLADAASNAPENAARRTLEERRSSAAVELTDYLEFLGSPDVVTQLLDLHVAVRSVLPVLIEVEQPVELVQVSADTRTRLAPDIQSAAAKLTGLQVHHFGAFYKATWRANDWMWGRLDGCGWLVHLLLDPRRVLAVLENDGVPMGDRQKTFMKRLGTALDTPDVPPELGAQLAFLDDEAQPVPASLPELSNWVASVLQTHIVAAELPVLAKQLREGREPLSADERHWLTDYDEAAKSPRAGVLPDGEAARLLDSCPVAGESLKDEANRRTPLFLRTATQTAAVATSAATGMRKPPPSLRPTFTFARTVTRGAYVIANKTGGQRRQMTLVAVGLMAAGVLAMLTDITFFGVGGIATFGIGAVALAFGLGRSALAWLKVIVVAALILLLAAPWLPWPGDRLFSWLRKTAVPGMHHHGWTWVVFVLLLLLPPVTWLVDLLRRKRAPAGPS